MSQVFRLKVDRFLEALMQNLINLIPNSAKIMSSSGIVAMRFIIQNTFSQKFLPIICSNIASKSREIRRHCCEFLDQLLHTWPTQPLVRIIYSFFLYPNYFFPIQMTHNCSNVLDLRNLHEQVKKAVSIKSFTDLSLFK
jgi:hypothetical protein